MSKKDSRQKKTSSQDPKIGRTIYTDLREGDIPSNLIQEFKDLYQFYIDQESKKKLARMGHVRRALKISWWVLKSMFFRLTPVRRILLLVGIVFIVSQSGSGDISNKLILGLAMILFVLMLELKDKILAHDELKIGRIVQMSLMPEKSPDIAGWDCWLFTRPANDVGGDLVDYLHINGTIWGLTLGDVAGKGLGAALLTAKLQATIRAIAPNFSSLTKLGKELNKIFYRDGLPNRFVSLVYLNIFQNSKEVKILNCGHMPPLMVRNNEVIEIAKGGTALGIMENANFFEQKITLQKDEVLIVYSDGITEARNKNDSFFGEQRLQGLLSTIKVQSAESIGKQVLRELEGFVGNARQNDDISLVILKKTT